VCGSVCVGVCVLPVLQERETIFRYSCRVVFVIGTVLALVVLVVSVALVALLFVESSSSRSSIMYLMLCPRGAEYLPCPRNQLQLVAVHIFQRAQCYPFYKRDLINNF
jgi:hypothetical protein